MTLDDLIEELQDRRKKLGKDVGVRVVTKRGTEGDHFDIIGCSMHGRDESWMVLMFAGELAAVMDWPTELVDDKM